MFLNIMEYYKLLEKLICSTKQLEVFTGQLRVQLENQRIDQKGTDLDVLSVYKEDLDYLIKQVNQRWDDFYNITK